MTERDQPGGEGGTRRVSLRANRTILLVLSAYLVMATAYSIATPIGEAPDETTHLEYVIYLRRHGRLPVIPEPPAIWPQQAKHPPLYYLSGGALTYWADFTTLGFLPNPHFSYNLEHAPVATAFVHFDHERFPYTEAEGFLAARVIRLVGLLSGLVVVWATFQLGRLVWPSEPQVAWGSAAVVAFVPGFLFFSGIYNNDNMASAWTALALLGSTRVVLGCTRRRDFVWLGVVLGLGLMTKLTTIAAVGVAGLSVLIHAYRTRSWRVLPRAAAEIGVPVVAITGWWFVRNMRLYGVTDPLAMKRWSATIYGLARKVPLREELGAYFWVQLTTFWGRFGWATIPLPEEVYWSLLVLMTLSGLGLVVLTLRWRRITAESRWGLAFVGLAVALMYASVFQLAFSVNLVVAHGRLVYIALSGLGVLFVAGLSRLFPRPARGWAILAVVSSMLVLSVVGLFGYVIPAYRRPEPLTSDQIAAISHRADVEFDERFRLVGYDVSAERVTAGRPVTVTLYWGALPASWDPFPPPSEGHLVFVHAVDATGEVVGRLDTIPFRGVLPAVGWPPGLVFREEYVVPISADAIPGRAALLVGLYQSEAPMTRLVARRNGADLGDAFRIEPLVIRPVEPVVAELDPANVRGDTFVEGGSGDEEAAVRLLGYGLVTDDGGWLLTLYWQPATDLGDGLHRLRTPHLVPTGAPVDHR